MTINQLAWCAFAVWITFAAAQLLLASRGMVPPAKYIENKYFRRTVFVLLLPLILPLGLILFAIDKAPPLFRELTDGFVRIFVEVWGE